ncbi:MAG TPA: substrate-binding domain-containing protein [Burkholderiales bacterium]
MHTAFEIGFDPAWLTGTGFPRERSRVLLRLLGELARSGSLREAARTAEVSYRSAWGTLVDGARLFGAPLVDMGRGRPARLSALGLRVLEADRHVRATLAGAFEGLRNEIPGMLADALPGTRPRLVLHASHDLALVALSKLADRSMDLRVTFCGAEDALASLARGTCDIAGFHVADALPRAAAAAAALGRWLDPRRHVLMHFVSREQGLIARRGSRIRGLHDLTRSGLRFIHRQDNRAPESAEASVAGAVAEGRADAGFGLRADAARHRLAFTPLAVERYFLACPRSALRGPGLTTLLRLLRSAEFAAQAAAVPGYIARHAGKRVSLEAALAWVKRPSPSPRP